MLRRFSPRRRIENQSDFGMQRGGNFSLNLLFNRVKSFGQIGGQQG